MRGRNFYGYPPHITPLWQIRLNIPIKSFFTDLGADSSVSWSTACCSPYHIFIKAVLLNRALLPPWKLSRNVPDPGRSTGIRALYLRHPINRYPVRILLPVRNTPASTRLVPVHWPSKELPGKSDLEPAHLRGLSLAAAKTSSSPTRRISSPSLSPGCAFSRK